MHRMLNVATLWIVLLPHCSATEYTKEGGPTTFPKRSNINQIEQKLLQETAFIQAKAFFAWSKTVLNSASNLGDGTCDSLHP